VKKIINVLLMLSLIIPILASPIDVNAKTLRDLTKELDAMEAEYNRNIEEKKLTERQINNIHASINNIGVQVNNLQKNISDLSNEIVILNDNISSKDKEIKDIVNFIQISNGESAYLEYAFGAQSFTDFIYRMAISEQLAKYNQDLIQSFNAMIEENNKKVTEMNNKTNELNQRQIDLSSEIKKLGSKLSDLIDISISVEEEIKLQRDAIKLYRDMGCGLDEDIRTCGRNKLPPGTAFFRPVVNGVVTSDFGWRDNPLRPGTASLHEGIDISSYADTPIYAAADGMVIAVTNRSSCGGNIVYIHHNVNGKYYTTLYAHLKTITVTPQQTVSRSTQIGVMGGDSSTPWDGCSTGRHLHFQIANGLYLKDYYQWSALVSRSFDPRQIINFPKWGVRFTDRFIKY
jgi:murein DD-endopeptidase MepM/ murein hydrolase activator NlpD